MASPSFAEERELAYPRLIELGIALSAEHNHNRLLEKILLGAKEMTNADGGSLYLVGEAGRELRFMIMRNDTMGMALGAPPGRRSRFRRALCATATACPTTRASLRRRQSPARRSTSPMRITRRVSTSAARAPSMRGPAIARNRF
jgi:hypothetical protein